ncbi:hypothetical protein GGR56DRAFT_400035 [Xylariaceae sp. FL0804]|nr:hypothetical protein GGR56DRAFT_400035 [Xylariaceae sp. FL0804]
MPLTENEYNKITASPIFSSLTSRCHPSDFHRQPGQVSVSVPAYESRPPAHRVLPFSSFLMAGGSSRRRLSRWGLPRWLALIRLLQALGSMVTAVMNGFVLVYIHLNQHGQTGALFSLEMMACVVLIYAGLVLLIQHTGRRRENPSARMLSIFVVVDVLVTGLLIGIITVLASAGAPTDCRGLPPRPHGHGSTVGRVTSALANNIRPNGDKLDRARLLHRFCAEEKAFYFITVILVFEYMATVTLGVLRILERYYTENSHIDQLLTTADNIHQLESNWAKAHRPDSVGGLEEAATSSHGITERISRPSPTLSSQEDIRPVIAFPMSTFSSSREQSRTGLPSPSGTPASPSTPRLTSTSTFRPVRASTSAFGASSGALMIEHTLDPGAEATVTDGYRHPMHSGMPSLPPYTPSPSQTYLTEGPEAGGSDMRPGDYTKGAS